MTGIKDGYLVNYNWCIFRYVICFQYAHGYPKGNIFLELEGRYTSLTDQETPLMMI